MGISAGHFQKKSVLLKKLPPKNLERKRKKKLSFQRKSGRWNLKETGTGCRVEYVWNRFEKPVKYEKKLS